MKKFNVTVNGTSYEVEVEEIGGAAPVISAPVAPAVAAPVPVAPAASAPKKADTAAPAGAQTISAPMPGTILKVLAAEGTTVTAGQPIVILEAMKMENELVAPKDGTVAKIYVSQGDTVGNGDAIAAIS